MKVYALLAMLVLTSCSSPRVAYKDFCEKQDRQISTEERIIFVLQEIAKREQRFGYLQFFGWKKDYEKIYPGASEEEVAKAYYKTVPSCCEVLPPAYLSRELLSDHDWDTIVEELLRRHPGYWVVDVRLPVKARPQTSKRTSIEFERIGVSACNDKISAGGFWL